MYMANSAHPKGWAPQTVDKKLFSPRRGRIALSANKRIAEFLDFAIQAKFAYVNKLQRPSERMGAVCCGRGYSSMLTKGTVMRESSVE